jgi:hypothetical protein
VSWIGEVDVGDLVEVGAPHRTSTVEILHFQTADATLWVP